jgi:PAS domain S-box-containing protein/putative nucleotidyltransferase with HDIG domain
MKDNEKTNERQITEWEQLRQRITELERSNSELKRVEKELKNSEERSNALTENVPIGIYYSDLNGTFLYGNKKAEEIVGYNREELIGKSFLKLKLLSPKDIVRAAKLLLLNKQGKSTGPDEFVITRKDGTKKLVEINTRVATLTGKRAVIGMVQDITERKQMEEALRESEEKYRELINGMNDTAWVIDFNGNFIDVNDAAVEVLGYSRKELLSMGPHDIDSTLDTETITGLIKGMRTEKIQVFDTSHTTKDGKVIPVEIKSSLVTYQGKRAILSIARDITQRKRAEAALQESEQRYRSLVDNIDLGINLIDPEHNIIMVNCTQSRHLNKPLNQTIGKKCYREFEKRDAVCPHCPGVQTMATGQPAEAEIEVTGDDQRRYTLRIQTFPVLGQDGTMTAFIEVVEDITERKRMEQELRDSEERYKALYEDNPSMYFTVDTHGMVLSVNQFGAKELGYTVKELVGQPLLNVFYDDDKEAVQQQLAACLQNPQELFHWEFRKVRKDGNIMWVKEAARAVRRIDGKLVVFIVCEDISERKQAEGELRESEERYRTFFEHAGFAMTLFDAETGNRVAFNTMAHESLGYTRKEFQELTAADLTVNKDPKVTAQHFKSIIEQGSDLYKMKLVAKNGKIRDELISAVPMRIRGKDFIQMIRVDVTDQKRAELELKESFERLRRSLESTISALASALELRDPYTAGHQQRVADLACAIAEEMGLGEEQVAGLRMAGLIHDIGKINIPAEILNKPGQLNEIEYSLFKNHPQVGHDLLETVEFPWPVAQIVLQHHERMDGSGYPQGLTGEEIILEARILAVADIIEAIASHRPYRPARGIGDALEEILHNKGILYDPAVVDACLRVFYDKGFTFEELAKVVTASPKIH